MIGRFRATWLALAASPLLADLGPGDRRFWRTLLAAVTGVAAGFVAISVLAVLIMIAGAVLLLAQGYDPNDLQRLISDVAEGVLPMTLSVTLGVIAALAILNGLLALVIVAVASLIVKNP